MTKFTEITNFWQFSSWHTIYPNLILIYTWSFKGWLTLTPVPYSWSTSFNIWNILNSQVNWGLFWNLFKHHLCDINDFSNIWKFPCIYVVFRRFSFLSFITRCGSFETISMREVIIDMYNLLYINDQFFSNDTKNK